MKKRTICDAIKEVLKDEKQGLTYLVSALLSRSRISVSLKNGKYGSIFFDSALTTDGNTLVASFIGLFTSCCHTFVIKGMEIIQQTCMRC
mgnify:CR=1 FL=1